MGQAAARVGDMHVKGVILEGSPTVRIGGMPAARMGDKAQCGNGIDTIAEGEPTVRINGKLAARVGDKHGCKGVIITGCPTVRIGLNKEGRCLQVAAQSGTPMVRKVETE